MALMEVGLDDKYRLDAKRIFLSGTQALVRLPMLQRERDRAQGLNTAGFISGYRGSPLGMYDHALWRAKSFLKEHDIEFAPGLNEDLAATAVWGSQQVGMFPGAKVDGVFGIWYGKGPGVDRSMDALKHANSAGTSPTTSAADLYASLAANGGTASTDLAQSTQAPSGLLRPFGSSPKDRSLRASVQRQMWPWLETFADFSYDENRSHSVYSPFINALTVPLTAPTNPFTTAVSMRIPDAAALPLSTNSSNRSLTVGAIAKLPWDWTAEADYTWTENRFDYFIYNNNVSMNGIAVLYDTTAVSADLASGALNPFVDTLRYPLNLAKYAATNSFSGSSELHDVNLRASGPLLALPWGKPWLTVGLEHRFSHTPTSTLEARFPITTANNSLITYYPHDSVNDAGYTETTIPMLNQD